MRSAVLLFYFILAGVVMVVSLMRWCMSNSVYMLGGGGHGCHKTDPDFMPRMQVDTGAIRFVLRGANIMCAGLTSPGGRMMDVEANTKVVCECWPLRRALSAPTPGFVGCRLLCTNLSACTRNQWQQLVCVCVLCMDGWGPDPLSLLTAIGCLRKRRSRVFKPGHDA